MLNWSKRNDVLGTVNRGEVTEAGLCTLCRADCRGKCETWLSSLQGRKLLYPRDFGQVTAGSGNTVARGVGYHSLRIQGYSHNARGLPPKREQSADNCLFTSVSLTTEFGSGKERMKSRLPVMTGALGSTKIAARYWDPLAVGAALVGIPIVIGENVVGVDEEAVLQGGRILKAPELDRRIAVYQRYSDGFGAIIVQLNVEDMRNGVAEYIIDKYGDRVMIELKWGQGAKNIGGEIQVNSLEQALFLKERGYLVDPDPSLPRNQAAFKSGSLRSFARHSRLGGTASETVEQLGQEFFSRVEYLKKLGFKRISLKTGAYGMKSLAMALRFAAEAGLDLLTIDGAGGGTGMSPWNMMEHWGIPSLELHVKAVEYADILSKRGIKVPDLALGGGLAREDHLFKALALGSPYVSLVCMGRAPMIPAFLGSNIEGVLHPERREECQGHWDRLPAVIEELGHEPESIFACWYEVEEKLGAEEMKKIPYGAVALWTLFDKLGAGLQQLMAGARKFNLESIERSDLVSANSETRQRTGIPYLTEAFDEEARMILNQDSSGLSCEAGL